MILHIYFPIASYQQPDTTLPSHSRFFRNNRAWQRCRGVVLGCARRRGFWYLRSLKRFDPFLQRLNLLLAGVDILRGLLWRIHAPFFFSNSLIVSVLAVMRQFAFFLFPGPLILQTDKPLFHYFLFTLKVFNGFLSKSRAAVALKASKTSRSSFGS